ncbi:MAG: quinolinate synthase NadA [Chloroflexi bacterium]|nr:quinolinate synthase NadA [Chloroflexota bacterium]MDA1271499.1 quinolinate synthase NadA [Chloroflexota bacterium]PKB58595.1 MAG: quinolinate synthetase [SAR202 cluster bacterium Casp-Chloro-G2]
MAVSRRRPSVPITELEHSAFCKTEDELPSKPLAEEMSVNVRWQNIPTEYLHLTADELDLRIGEARKKLGSSVTILGHHYQREEVIKYADFQGDSYLLSVEAASRPEADYIIFCGVHFMAETACILAAPHQKVILPNITAGCSMADMAPMDDVEDAWEDLEQVLGPGGILPVTYMNSIAGIKALCGRNGGTVCTSSNAKAVLKWAFERSERVLFLPDQHLGRNTALDLGIPLDEMVVWNPFRPLGGNTPEQLRRSKMVLWQGHCSVHTRFTVGQIEAARALHPDINILVHPECPMETVQAADWVGSTEFIREKVNSAPAGSKWGIGTEVSLVNRLAINNPDKTVFCLDPVTCPCSTMYRIHPAYVLWMLDGLLEGTVHNQITVPDDIKRDSRIALDRMLALK